MSIKMVNNKIGILKIGKSNKKEDPSIFATVEVADNLGIVKFVSDNSTYSVGTKVYYGSKREQIKMNNLDIQVMDEDNIYAVVKDSHEEINETKEE